MATAYLRFRLGINKNTDVSSVSGVEAFLYAEEFIKKWTYKVIAQGRPDGVIPFKKPFKYEFSGTFNALLRGDEHKMESHQYSIAQMNDSFKITWILSFNGKERYRVRGHFFDHSIESGRSPRDGGGEALFDTYSINFTPAITTFKEEKARLRIQQISGGTGWYLVKQPETFGDLMKRIFINPSKIDWDIMRENNAHLGNVQMMTLLHAGQVVVVALERNSAKVKALKEDAKLAQAEWQKIHASVNFNPLYFQTMDVLVSAGGVASIAKKTSYDPSVTWLGELTPQMSLTSGGLKLLTLDSFLAFNDGALKRTGKAYRSAMQNIQVAANSAGKATNIGKRAITAMPSSEIAILKSQLGNSLLRAETGLQVDSLRSQMQELAQVRDIKTQGGIKNYTAYMKTSGLASKALSGGNVIALGIEAFGAGSNIVDAHAEGREVYRKAVITETLKVGASAAGGAVGGKIGYLGGAGLVLLIGATGGTALVVIGIATVVGAGVGQIGGKMGGEMMGTYTSEKTDLLKDETNALFDLF